ncbi:MAG: MFS transporter [Candidatus Latescibacteria bacterium]|nr:MFS transporter [Candidatus Latescibacterota bacterium]
MGLLPEGKDARFNFIVGLLNGVIFTFGMAFMDATTVLPVFIKRYTTSDTIVGLASALHRAGWHLPQLFVASYLERKPLKLGVYLRANMIRMILIWCFILLLALYGTTYPGWVIFGYLAFLGVASIFGGIAGLPFTDIVGKVIPRSHTGIFYAIRFFFGAGILSILAGVIVEYVLRIDSPFVFPQNYVLLFSLAAGFMCLGIFATSFMREPEGKVSETKRSVGQFFREIPVLLRADANFQTLLIVQVLASGIGFSLPFYVVFAREYFLVPESMAGLFLVTQTIGFGLSNVAWGRISTRYGNRQVITGTAVCLLLIPTLALVLAFVTFESYDMTWLFYPIFFLIGATSAGTFIGFKSYILDIAPEDRRPTYIGITNTVMGFAALFPALGGVMADLVSFEGVFVVSGGFVAVGAMWSLKLKRIHH